MSEDITGGKGFLSLGSCEKLYTRKILGFVTGSQSNERCKILTVLETKIPL
jgi:hypothetical protein